MKIKSSSILFFLLVGLSNCYSQHCLAGFAYSRMLLMPRSVDHGTDHMRVTEKLSYGGRFTILSENSPVSFCQEVSFSPVHWEFSQNPDTRYRSIYFSSTKQWGGTKTICDAKKLDLASYLMLTTKEKWIRAFVAPGLGIMFSMKSHAVTTEKYSYEYIDSTSIPWYYILDSTTVNTYERNSRFAYSGFYFGLQSGFIFRIPGGIYLTVTGHILRFKYSQQIPLISEGFILSADIGLHYNLAFKKQSKPPPN